MVQKDRQQLMLELFTEAQNLTPEARTRFLRDVCGRDVALYESLLTLMSADEKSNRALDAIEKARDRALEADDFPTAPLGQQSSFSPGQVLDHRYRIDAFLGRGGMGEVWRAYDLKLRVDVALKSLRRDRFPDEEALEWLRREVRSARKVLSPNVCRIFDLVVAEDQELVSMEYIDGTTLLRVLSERAPLELREAMEISSQFLSGLDAIHEVGLIHRDVKPENIMITRSGRVVLMDFGLTRAEAEGGSIAGTPAYMAPEHLSGGALDARADIFSAGVVLAELIAGDAAEYDSSRERLHRVIHQDPPQVPHCPWEPVLTRAVSKSPAHRFASARELIRALEEVTLRAERSDDVHPYPGLTSFAEKDAPYFFGRELDVETLWKQLPRTHLIGLIGPSGVGKSSFLQAGLLPAVPTGWRHISCRPGDEPVEALGKALAPELAGDEDALPDLVRFNDVEVAVSLFGRWRRRHSEVLLIIDQFEELFTMTREEQRERFSECLGRLSVEADVHVLLSMRDDFVFRCSDHPALAPIFTELFPLRPLSTEGLRRALVQPALLCGYRFEEEALVEEMLSEVTGERGALPLLAFSVARLWERREQATGHLTRTAFVEIGGVGGALARHAEVTLDRIGPERESIVREMFRNLVTAQGTRAARDTDELLSVFEDRQQAQLVLQALVDARLLTSFEVRSDEDGATPARRVEIIHESLLTAWPRLVRWQIQDADGAQLRDQLRQAAHLWDERGRLEDFLWSGSAYKEYQLWRERYPGGLTETEEAFVGAMVAHAERRRRRRRAVVVSALGVLLCVLVVVAGLWQRSESARREATTEARRAEAGRLLAIARSWLDQSPTVALAHAIASLELEDTATIRRLILETLWKAPTYSIPTARWTTPGNLADAAANIDFSPDGRWLAVAGGKPKSIRVYPMDGGSPTVLGTEEDFIAQLLFDEESPLIYCYKVRTDGGFVFDAYSVPDGDIVFASERLPRHAFAVHHTVMNDSLIVTSRPADTWVLESWPMGEGEPRLLGEVPAAGAYFPSADPTGTSILCVRDSLVSLLPLDGFATAEPRLLGYCRPDYMIGPRLWLSITWCQLDPGARQVLVGAGDGIRVYSTARGPESAPLLLRGPEVSQRVRFDPTGGRVAAAFATVAGLWDLSGPRPAEPLLLYGFEGYVPDIQFHPDGTWLATTGELRGLGDSMVAVWPLGRPYPRTLPGRGKPVYDLAFTPDGASIVASSGSTVSQWPLGGEGSNDGSWTLAQFGTSCWEIAMYPAGGQVLAKPEGSVALVSLHRADDAGEGVEVERLPGFEVGGWAVAFSRDGRLAAAGDRRGNGKESGIYLLDLESGDQRWLEHGGDGTEDLQFTPDGGLITAGPELRLWNLDDGSYRTLLDGPIARVEVSPDGARAFLIRRASETGPAGTRSRYTATGAGSVVLLDLSTGETTSLASHGDEVVEAVFDPSGTRVVSGDGAGVVRVGPITGEEPHLLLGHEASVLAVAVSPDGQWIASGGNDKTIRLWPMPDGTPFHTLPPEEFHARVCALTNLRLTKDEGVETGYRITLGEFPGWDPVPSW